MTIAAALTRLRYDLVQAGARGAVGAYDAHGTALYIYPEIAGYWLRWASARGDVSNAAGEAMLTCLEAIAPTTGVWPTRVALGAVPLAPVYRDAHYLFDHAMLWDGLHAWCTRRASQRAAALAERVALALAAFVANEGVYVGVGTLPTRWSGKIGPFLLKVCARLQDCEVSISGAFSTLANQLRKRALSAPHAEHHAQLYAIEGLCLLGKLEEARQALDRLCALRDGAGMLREHDGLLRWDVQAQLLRTGLWLQTARRTDPSWRSLAQALASTVDDAGRLPFAEGIAVCPTWTALFAEQALTMWQGEKVSPESDTEKQVSLQECV